MDTFETVELGGKVQELAEPAEGENVQELAEPAEDTLPGEAGGESEEQEKPEEQAGAADEEHEGTDAPEAEQSQEDRRRNAALRRRQEQVRQQQMVEAEKRAAQARVDKAYADLYAGKINPYNNKPITTEAEYLAYKQTFDQEKIRQQMDKSGLPVEAINSIVDNHPAIKKAQEVIRQAEETTAAARQVQAKEGIANELKIISALDPSIKTLEDLMAMEGADRFFGVVKNGGLSLSDAFKLVNFDQLTARKTAAAKQAAINQAAGKGHLTATASRGAGGVTIPADTLEMYRQIFPNKSDAEFQKHYATHNKKE